MTGAIQPVQDLLGGKELITRTLDPGQSLEGFIYFRFSKSDIRETTYHVIAEAKNLSTGSTNSFGFPVELTPLKP